MEQTVWRDFITQLEKKRVTGVVLYQNGVKTAEHHFDDEHRRNQYSATKSFTALAVGIAEKEGLLSLDERIADCFPEDLPKNPSENLLSITVRDALAMSLGQDRAYLMGGDRFHLKETDWIKYVLSGAVVNKPGSVFLYNNAGPYLAGRLVQKRAGCSLTDYLMPRFFERAGIYRPTWELDPLGYSFGAGGLMLCVSELAQWGLLFLQNGWYNGKQLLNPVFVKKATSLQTPTPDGKKDAGYGYGLGLWLGANGSFSADGKYGQFCLVMRDKNAVLAVNAESRSPQEILDTVWDVLYPAL